MDTMKAMTLSGAPSAFQWLEREVPVPVPGMGEVLIRVHAAGVTPTELAWYPTTHTKAGGERQNAVPGHEFSGVVAALGPRVEGLALRQEVYGMNDWFADGATAEFCLCRPSQIAEKPHRLSHVEAASVPIGALTAWQGLFDRAHLRAGERVLIHGGAGAVGVFAVQLARVAGARVLATASARNFDFLKELGAEIVIDYKTRRFEEECGQVEVVFDAVGGETLRRSWGVLRPGGRLVTIAASEEATPDERTKAAFFIVEPNPGQLQEIAQRLDQGGLRAIVDGVVPLADASAAYLGAAMRRHGRGKVVVEVAG